MTYPGSMLREQPTGKRWSVLATIDGLGVIRHIVKADDRREAQARVARAYSKRSVGFLKESVLKC